MDVNGINKNYINPNLVSAYKKNTPVTKEISDKSNKINDKIEISSEAKKLKGNRMDEAKLSEVKEKVNSGFYKTDTVLNKVVDKIYKEIVG